MQIPDAIDLRRLRMRAKCSADQRRTYCGEKRAPSHRRSALIHASEKSCPEMGVSARLDSDVSAESVSDWRPLVNGANLAILPHLRRFVCAHEQCANDTGRAYEAAGVNQGYSRIGNGACNGRSACFAPVVGDLDTGRTGNSVIGNNACMSVLVQR
jgi:hypothetical protein